MTATDESVLRPMQVLDLSAGLALSQQMNWPHRAEDWALMHRVSESFALEDAGGVIGTTFTCNQGEYATVGLVMVAPTHQGKGLGRRLMQRSLEAAGERQILLNATVAGVPLYQRLGFVTYGSLHQHQGVLAQAPQQPPLGTGERMRHARAGDMPALQELARQGSGFDRQAVLGETLAVATDIRVLERDGQPCAFAVARQFGRGQIIGPLFAASLEQAWTLTAALLQALTGQFVRIDCPADSGLSEPLTALGLAHVDSAEQMVRGTPPSPADIHQFTLINQALY